MRVVKKRLQRVAAVSPHVMLLHAAGVVVVVKFHQTLMTLLVLALALTAADVADSW